MTDYVPFKRTVFVALLAAIVFASETNAGDKARVLFDFDANDAATQWQTVNDGVMGGVSEGRFKSTDRGVMEFYGTLSLENSGGFASVRSRGKQVSLKDGDVIVARLRGDGRTYYFNLQVPTFRIAFSYRTPFQTRAGEWQKIKVPLKDFQATSFGRPVMSAGPVDASEVNSLGFLLADKKAGPFQLEVDWIKVLRADAEK